VLSLLDGSQRFMAGHWRHNQSWMDVVSVVGFTHASYGATGMWRGKQPLAEVRCVFERYEHSGADADRARLTPTPRSQMGFMGRLMTWTQ
jgi:hypothetical protein